MSTSYSVVYFPESMDDLKEIYAYIAFTLLVPETAEKQVNRIRHEMVLIPTCKFDHIFLYPSYFFITLHLPLSFFLLPYRNQIQSIAFY